MIKIKSIKIANADDAHCMEFIFSICYQYGLLAVVFADHLQEALDIAADSDCLKGLHITKPRIEILFDDDVSVLEEYIALGNDGALYDLNEVHTYKTSFDFSTMLADSLNLETLMNGEHNA